MSIRLFRDKKDKTHFKKKRNKNPTGGKKIKTTQKGFSLEPKKGFTKQPF
jgi:hypothetical protein